LATHNADVIEDLLPSPSGEFRFEEYVSVILRGKWIILGSIFLLTTLMLVYTIQSPAVYEASAQILVDSKRSAQRLSIGTPVDDNFDNKVANDLGILKSRVLAQLVAAALLESPYLDTVSASGPGPNAPECRMGSFRRGFGAEGSIRGAV